MEMELNKLFNDTNYNKANVIIREIWSIKLEFPNFFEEFRFRFEYVQDDVDGRKVSDQYIDIVPTSTSQRVAVGACLHCAIHVG